MHDNELNNNPEEENFSELLENSMPGKDDFAIGDKVEGKIVYITKDSIFVDISGKSEAIIEPREFFDESDELTVKTGDKIEAFVVSSAGGEIVLTKNIGRGQTGLEHLNLAFNNRIPVTGTVTSEIKGGFSVSISGIKCFCPFSHFDTRPAGDPGQYINKSFDFYIIQYTERGRNIILSRRELLEEIKDIKEAELKETLKEGDTVEGTVLSVKDFGLFVDLDGVEALVPKSELSWSRNPDIYAYSAGKRVTAKVLSLDWDNNRISLSFKAAMPDPWEENFKYEKGMTVPAKIRGMIKNGAFAEIEPGVEGFIHVSRMSFVKRINRPEDAVSINQPVSVKINEIYPDKRKIDLELVTAEEDPWIAPESLPTEKPVTGTIESVVNAGVRVRLENGMQGFIPKSELASDDQNTAKKYTTGSTITAAVKEIDPEKRNLILSEKNADALEGMNNYKKFAAEDQAGTDSSLGSMFKSQFDDIKKKIGDKS